MVALTDSEPVEPELLEQHSAVDHLAESLCRRRQVTREGIRRVIDQGEAEKLHGATAR